MGLLAGILAALVWSPLSEWWCTGRYLQAAERQEKFLEEYDVCAVSPADEPNKRFRRLQLATLERRGAHWEGEFRIGAPVLSAAA